MAGPIRQPIDLQNFEKWISSNVPEIKVPLEVKQFGFGQSNPTYQLKDTTGKKYVLRKKPPGTLLSKTAHQVEREYKIIHALERTDVAVPKAYTLCEDSSVIGTPFYIMEFLDGRIFEEAHFPDVSPEERTALWKEAVRTLAKLHSADRHKIGLGEYGKPSGFYNRQISTLSRIQDSQSKVVDKATNQAVGKLPYWDEMTKFFSEEQPQDRSTLIHGDYKIDNLVYHKTEPRIIGILDWEMSTVGHPLSDLSNLLTPYMWGETPIESLQGAFGEGKTPGLPTKKQVVQWYAEIAGWDPAPVVAWGSAFSLLRNCVIVQGIAARLALGQASSAQAKLHADRMPMFAQYTYSLVENLEDEIKERKEEQQKTKAKL